MSNERWHKLSGFFKRQEKKPTPNSFQSIEAVIKFLGNTPLNAIEKPLVAINFTLQMLQNYATASEDVLKVMELRMRLQNETEKVTNALEQWGINREKIDGWTKQISESSTDFATMYTTNHYEIPKKDEYLPLFWGIVNKRPPMTERQEAAMKLMGIVYERDAQGNIPD